MRQLWTVREENVGVPSRPLPTRLLRAGSLLLLLSVGAVAGQETEKEERAASERRMDLSEALAQMAPRYQDWIRSVAGLISQAEAEYFVSLPDYRKDGFMETFWEPRDPDPLTPGNELRRRWQEYLQTAGGLPYGDPRFLLYLFNGPPGRYTLPDGRGVSRCFSKTKELEIWFYDGSERTPRRFLVILQQRGTTSPYEAWVPGGFINPVGRQGGLPTTDVRLLCADELLRYAQYEIGDIADYDELLDEVLSPPMPSAEWLANLIESSTEVPEGAELFQAQVELRYPARRQSRTAVEVLFRVPLEEAPGRRFENELFHHFIVKGEIIRNDRLFEDFDYRFEGPTPEGATEVPLGFTRFLRPGPATIRVLVEDVFSGKYAQFVADIEVPKPAGRPAVEQSREVTERATGPSLRLLSPGGDLQVGMVRFEAVAEGEFDRVFFYLDDKPVISKRRPPYSVELDLGEVPQAHRVRVVGKVGDEEVATDQIWLNQGSQRFRVRMIEPRPGGIYPGSLTARVEVDTPDGQPPERVELFVNDEPVAVLEAPPYVHSLRLPSDTAAVVRAVAFREGGARAEDSVIVNASAFAEAVEVQLVEVSALVLGADGKPLRGLDRDLFQIVEDGKPQRIERFEETADAPIHLALLIDRSISMEPHLRAVAEAALGFATAALDGPEDRVAIASFADQATVDAGFTDSRGQLERALAGLDSRGGTALFDSIVQTLNNFAGVGGQTALVLFSDGRDESSQLSFEQALETARRAGVTIYTMGLEASFQDREIRRVLQDLAEESGGAAFFLGDLTDLDAIYGRILEELRSRYLLAYQSTSSEPEDVYRTIRVEVDVRGAEVRARTGYYP